MQAAADDLKLGWPAVQAAVDQRVSVAFLIDELCTPGGAEKIFVRSLALLPRDRFRPLAITFKTAPSFPGLADFPCPLTVLPLGCTYNRNGWRVARTLASMLRQQRVQIVHTFFETSDLWGGVIAKLAGCPLLISSRRDMGIQRTAKHGTAYRLLGGLFDEVQTVSEAVRRQCIEQDRLRPERVRTLYSGVALSTSPALRLCPSNAPIITAVGHIRKVKGFDIFIRAAAKVCRRYPRAIFQIAGGIDESDHFQELQNMVCKESLEENVRFLGPCRDVASILERSDLFCLPSRSEGLSNALLEAMAAGLPCVATRVGGNGELIENGVGGFLVENEDAEGAAQALLDLLAHPEKALQMGRINRKLVEERFSETVMIEELVRSYERLLCKRKR